jgi:hypothetical protein
MATFTVRVQLKNVSNDESEVYSDLHDEMRSRGFSRTITSDDGVTYDLPNAEYNFEGNKTRSEVLALAKAASKKAVMYTDNEYMILVTESKGRTWFGMEKVSNLRKFTSTNSSLFK